MKRIFSIIALSAIILLSCSSKDSAKSVAQKWCDLNGKYTRATEGAVKDAAKAAREKFENDMVAKYKGKDDFMKEVGKEVEKCEATSEGK